MKRPSLERRVLGIVVGGCVWLVVAVSCAGCGLSSDLLQDSVEDYSAVRVVFGVLIPILVGLLPGAFVYHVITSSQQKFPAGHCDNCGYNLTGNVSGVCPECGTKVKD